MKADKAQEEIAKRLTETAAADNLPSTDLLKMIIERYSILFAAEVPGVLYVGTAKASAGGKAGTFVIHEGGVDLLVLSDDKNWPRIDRRLAGPESVDYREELTLDLGEGGAFRIDAVISCPLLKEPMRNESLTTSHDFDEARSKLVEWARAKPS